MIRSVESRMYPRESIDLTVMLVRQGAVLASAKAVNMSSGGVAIELPKIRLAKGQVLDVNLTKSGYPRGANLNVRAMVIYTDIEKVGLMFSEEVKLSSLPPEIVEDEGLKKNERY